MSERIERTPAAVAHGGNLHDAAERYGIPYDAWIDLSTGINPHGYPVPPVPASAWRRLPDDGDGFAACAARYYGAPDERHVLPVAGSQAAIRALPALLPRGAAAIAPLTYGEYAPAFARAGHAALMLDATADTLPDGAMHAVVVNPDNPTATRVPTARLLRWREQLAARGGTLIVDEAFADAFAPKQSSSLAASAALPGLVVLRSPGKFFGIAGARCGFALAQPDRLHALRAALGAWTVGGPARHAVRHAFADTAWQTQMRGQLAADSARLAALLQAHGLAPRTTPLFAWVADPRAQALHEGLARRGVWTRLFASPASVRFGLPASDDEWLRFGAALADAMRSLDPGAVR
ncbi:threonine-phosphate decarboxylase CobD [Paraburkholderia caballeronis]|uniref:threonine-phosphate decarboxylase n=1 Tax=Paraburkholderia caballeronis TaxID=416943 RepID=A0A1H7R8M1_9BURK|nr:threonine-phosphate decarboxylase CobD [Paraburkholderia caballeronis]PXW23593.1 L-threonine O-3-phosphate decarboxylase [Paraburkholderia caballeronis]PXW98934.1 L-threonine O-3-phosphate decarboxylase [Paraburkholderia caballeronis]RAJ96140.1 L-threonine O-3-phosphate decarboxylase [Paraburkholderia caballeronis]SEC78348.1 L-threonine O-3-phosphate decarboxylase [Paraburkholderia caballeronis]SEL56591.1 L-threonine O-3-phosphate decarboxylase [Paraburkholderia caballeronis]